MKKFMSLLLVLVFISTNTAYSLGETLRVPVDKTAISGRMILTSLLEQIEKVREDTRGLDTDCRDVSTLVGSLMGLTKGRKDLQEIWKDIIAALGQIEYNQRPLGTMGGVEHPGGAELIPPSRLQVEEWRKGAWAGRRIEAGEYANEINELLDKAAAIIKQTEMASILKINSAALSSI